MRIFLCILFVFLIGCQPDDDLFSKKTTYQITPQKNNFVLVEIKTSKNYQTRYMLNPESYTAYRQLPPTREFNVRYEIIPKSQDNSLIDPVRANFAAEFFQLPGSSFLECFENHKNEKRTIKFVWRLPSHWNLANSFSAGLREQTISATCNDLHQGLYAGGTNFSLYQTQFGAMLIHGEFHNLTANDFEQSVLANMKKVLDFWKEPPKPYYLAIFHSSNNRLSQGGSAHLKAFEIVIPSTQKPDRALDILITHEYFHHWNGHQINLEKSEIYLDHVDILWFLEGFTDYYAFVLNNDWAPIETANTSLYQLKQDYTQNRAAKQLPYTQGRFIAYELDRRILSYSGGSRSLQNLMHEIIMRSRENSEYYLTGENILEAICEGQYMDCQEARNLIQKYAISGYPLIQA